MPPFLKIILFILVFWGRNCFLLQLREWMSVQPFILFSKAWCPVPLLLSPPSEQWFWIETCVCLSSGGGTASTGPRGWWPAGTRSSRSAASGWNHTAALCSPLWPREVAISEILRGRQVDGPEQGQKLAYAQKKKKAKKENSVQMLAVWTGRDTSVPCWVLLSSCFTEL